MERRSFHRVGVSLPGLATLDSGSRVPVTILDLSDGGAQIECDAFSSAILAPAMSCLDESGRVLELDLDCYLDDTPVRVRCRLVFVRRLSHDTYRIGLRYADPLQPELVVLKRYLHKL
ncbi:MAG: PilZ domain-containing protein [Methylohalobius sp.]|nr:PilZ domain-containing protein [Methylohalobius sp.]